MKNLKISNAMKCFVLAGTMFVCTGCSFAKDDFKNCNVFIPPLNVVTEEDAKILNDVLKKDLVPLPLDDNGKYTNIIKGNYIFKSISKSYINESGKIQFNDIWVMLNDEEKKDYTGLVKVAKGVAYPVYRLTKNKDGYSYKAIDFLNTNNYDNCYLALGEKPDLIDDTLCYMYNGKIVDKKRMR